MPTRITKSRVFGKIYDEAYKILKSYSNGFIAIYYNNNNEVIGFHVSITK